MLPLWLLVRAVALVLSTHIHFSSSGLIWFHFPAHSLFLVHNSLTLAPILNLPQSTVSSGSPVLGGGRHWKFPRASFPGEEHGWAVYPAEGHI